jgi:hypothetical protein
VMSTIDSRKRVRRRVRGTSVPAGCAGKGCETGSDEGVKGSQRTNL